MTMIQQHLADPDNLGVMIGNKSCPPYGVFVILHHKDQRKHRHLTGPTLEAILNPKPLLLDLDI